MRQVNCNYKRDDSDPKCPLCKKSEDTTEDVLECEKAEQVHTISENSNKIKKKIKVTVIQVQD